MLQDGGTGCCFWCGTGRGKQETPQLIGQTNELRLVRLLRLMVSLVYSSVGPFVDFGPDRLVFVGRFKEYRIQSNGRFGRRDASGFKMMVISASY